MPVRNKGSISTTCLTAAFTQADPKSAKKLLELTVFFALLGSLRRGYLSYNSSKLDFKIGVVVGR